MKKKLLIISSYKRQCGIAQYVEHLEIALRRQEELDVNIIGLPVDMLRSLSPHAKISSNNFIQKVCNEARQADVVNIQFEPGLFGISPKIIFERLKKIIDASKLVLITYHTVPKINSPQLQFNIESIKKYIKSFFDNYVFRKLFKCVFRNQKKFHHIVQTRREFLNFSLFGFDPKTISTMPLAFLTKDKKAELSKSFARSHINQIYGVKNKRVIGCFGFLSAYKGIETVIRSMLYLPLDYTLLIVGGLHPEGIHLEAIDQPYIMKLIGEIKSKKSRVDLVERVKFCGALNNDEFIQVMKGCDAVVLPYAEVGQTSSGPAAIALDLQIPVYASRNMCFRELDKFVPNILSLFEIGNHLELATKIRYRDSERPVRIAARKEYNKKFNVEARANIYVEAVNKLLIT